MEIPAERWFKSIFDRESRRKFDSRKIEKEKIERLQNLIDEVNDFLPGVKIIMVEKKIENIFTGIIGSYGKITGAPVYLAFIGNKAVPHIDENIGYGGESLILEATSLGLGSCWVSGTFNADKVIEDIKLSKNEKIYAVSPVGYAKDKPALSEKIFKKMVSSHKRKDMSELVLHDMNSMWPQWIKSALKAARLAPSAVNRQPWRFKIVNNTIIISAKKDKKTADYSYKLDCGIAMLHIHVGSLKEGVSGKWEYLDGNDIAKFIVN
ncbi:MAG: nitroreductase family protein [Bacillota bacterium]